MSLTNWFQTLLDSRRWSSWVSLQNVSNGQQTRLVAYVDATDIADATRKAYELATQGDVVLPRSSQCQLGYVC